jgi:predicted amidophosphoribosyltransferase
MMALNHRPRRLRREELTIAVMIRLYCRDQHGGADALCAECAPLLDYTRQRLECCRYGADKPACAHCPVHCYKPAMRAQIRAVMRYSGPRMAQRHPVLAAAHLLDRRKAPAAK